MCQCDMRDKQVETEASNGHVKRGTQGMGHIYPPISSTASCQANTKKKKKCFYI